MKYFSLILIVFVQWSMLGRVTLKLFVCSSAELKTLTDPLLQKAHIQMQNKQ